MSILIYPESELNDFDEFRNLTRGKKTRLFSEVESQEHIIFDGLMLKSIPVDERKTNESYKRFVKFLGKLKEKFNDYEVKFNDNILTAFPKPPSLLFDNLKSEDDVNIIQIRKIPGLVINKMLLKKISGPIEIAILKPKDRFFLGMKKKYNVNAPIFMMFGDMHTDRKTLCSLCDPENCMFIWDDVFYKLLDNMAVENHPIDINIEAFSFGRLPDNKDQRPIVKMARLYNRCLKQNALYSAESNLCPTRKLRYQYSDIRQTYQAHESVIGDSQFELFYWMISEFTQQYDDTNVIEELQKIVTTIRHKPDIFLFLAKCKGFYSNPSQSFYVKGIEDFPKSFLKKQYDKSPELHPFFDHMLRVYLNEKSTTSFRTNLIIVKYYEALEVVFTDIMSASFNVTSIQRKLSDYQQWLPLIQSTIFLNHAKFLDVYYLLRSFSRRNINFKREENNPLLSVSYFGFCHVLRLTSFLVADMYDVVYVNFEHSKGSVWDRVCSNDKSIDKKIMLSEELDNKCIEFNKHVNLDEIYNHYISLLSVPEKSLTDGKRKSRKKSRKKSRRKSRKSRTKCKGKLDGKLRRKSRRKSKRKLHSRT